MKTDVLYGIATVGFFLWTIRSLFYWSQLWQKVRYQPTIFLKSPKARERIWDYLASRSAVLTWIGILVAFYVTIEDYHEIYYQLFILVLFILKAGLVVSEILKNQFHKPIINFRSLSIIILSLLTITFFYSFPLTEKFIWLLILDRLVVFIISIFVFLFTFPSELIEDYKFREADKKLRQLKNLKTIGVLGGANTEHYIDIIGQILEEKIPISKVSDFDQQSRTLAEAILDEISQRTQVILVALDSADKYHFQQHLKLLRPNIIIIPYSLSLTSDQINFIFKLLGKKEKIILDYRLKHYISPKHLQRRQVVFFSSSVQQDIAARRIEILRATDVLTRKNRTDFLAILPTGNQRVSSPLITAFFVDPTLIAIYIADYLGLTKKEIANRVRKLASARQTLVLQKFRGGITIVNNTGNTSYEIVNHALSYLEKYNKKKIIIFGQSEAFTNEEEYKSFGKKIAHICTHAFFYQVARESLLRSIVRKERGKCKVYSAGDRKKLVDMLQKTVVQGDIVLFEGNTNEILTSFLGIASEPL
ncbi:MAG: hypothetical protein KatS3mg089_0445 [Patescibacteria group bacterium]|nr:MAG: hypothetical protein KatS3mg089_0445 [Patescibacteria group bacterium]